MHKLKFEVYIGTNMINGQSADIKAGVVPKFYIPCGKYNLDGTEVKHSNAYFKSLYDLGTYFSDWIDLFDNADLICAVIHLNILSLKKTFYGKEIVEIIDKIYKRSNYEGIKNFMEI